jgi:beta-xylosidase
MSFIDAYPGGRIPVLAPVTWADGWPTVTLDQGAWGASYPYPDVPRPPAATKPPTGIDTFADAALAPDWEWNHNPDDSKWSAGGKLTLQTATVTNDLYAARNTLTRRILGPESTATIELDYSMMRDGDRAGLALFRDSSAWVGVKRSGDSHSVVMVNGLALENGGWTTTSMGNEAASAPVSGGKIWLRISVDIRPGPNRQAHFFYSTDGTTFTELGPAFTMTNAWQFFMGYRFAIFSYATQSLGGAASVNSFEIETP